MWLHRLESLPDVGLRSRVDEVNAPVLDITRTEQLDVFAAVGKDEVVGGALAVVQKIMFDRLGLVAETKD